MQSFTKAILCFSLAMHCGAVFLQGHRQSGRMNPEVVARTLTEVEEKWMQQATAFARCNETSGTCVDDTMGEFEKSCQTVAQAIVGGSNGDKSDVQDYLADVCDQKSLEGWKREVCTGFSAALELALTEDSYTNREDVNLGKFCSDWLKNGFLKRAADEELAREAEERKRVEEEEKKAEEKAAEEERERAAEAKAEEARAKAEEAKRATEEAAKKKEEAQAQAAEAERKKAEAAEAEDKATKKSAEANVTVAAAQEAQAHAAAKSGMTNSSAPVGNATEAANTSLAVNPTPLEAVSAPANSSTPSANVSAAPPVPTATADGNAPNATVAA